MRFCRPRVLLLSLACAALALVHAAGAHLHLCLDGTQAPLSVHAVADAGHHPGVPHGGHHGRAGHDGHDDLDVKLGDSAPVKAGKTTPDVPLLAVLYVLALAALTPAGPQPAHRRVAVRRHRPRWRPPLRAPPLYSLI